MSRDLATDLLAAIQAGTVRPVFFYEGQFRNTGTMAVEYLRLWTGSGSSDWDSKSWTPTDLMAIDGIEETIEQRSVGFRVGLNGISSSILTVALDADKSRNLPATVWLAGLTADGAVIADPHLSRTGYLSKVSWSDNGLRCDITAEYEDENVALLIPFDRRYTPEDQAIDSPGDRGFDDVAQLQDKVIGT